LNPLSAELLNSITISHKANITIEADRASLLWSTMDDAFIEITQSSNINIRGLWLKGDADGAKHEQRGIQMFDHCSNILIENNQVENMGYDGILALYTVNNLKILNNDVIGCQDDGINPGGGGGNEEGIGQTVVSGNYIANSGSDGLHLSDRSRQTIATNNFIVNCNYGISIYNSSYNIISNNIITGCRYGIGTVFGLCPGLTISDNLINETTVGAGISLNGHGAHFSSVTGNKILYPAAYGIDIGASNNINIDDNTIKGGTRAIYISAYLVTVTNNNIWAPTNYGIVVSGVGTGNCTVIGNLIEYGCASGAIYISSSFNTVSQNILRTVGAGIIEPTTYGADYNIFSQCSSDKPIMLTGEHTSISQSWNGTTLINYMVGGVEKLP
jgi:parallel beta-helix repeat protein